MAHDKERSRIFEESIHILEYFEKKLNRYRFDKLRYYFEYNLAKNRMISLDQTKKKHHKEELQEYEEEITKLEPWINKSFDEKDIKKIKRNVKINQRLCYIGMFPEDDLLVDN